VKSILRANGGAAVAKLALACLVGALVATRGDAQKKGPEFTRQGLLITTFLPRGTADLGYGHKAADEVRGRVAKFTNKRDVDVISGGDIGWQLSRAGMPDDTLLDEPTIRTLGKLMRADEYVVGTVERAPEALAASRQALAVDSTLDRGELMIAQGEIERGRPDSALAALRRAITRGEDTALIAQLALGRGNALLRAANGTKSRDDFQLAMRFLALADTLRRTPQTAFLLGVAAYSITQSAVVDAPKMTEKRQSCELSHLGAETLPVARAGLEAGQEVSPEAAKQFLDYLGQLEPYVQRQLDAFCPKS